MTTSSSTPEYGRTGCLQHCEKAGPRIVEIDGKHVWNYDGQMYPTIGINAVAGKPPSEWGIDPVRYEDMTPWLLRPGSAHQRHGSSSVVASG
jgi:hypothetical protein